MIVNLIVRACAINHYCSKSPGGGGRGGAETPQAPLCLHPCIIIMEKHLGYIPCMGLDSGSSTCLLYNELSNIVN